jgi:Fe-Mn family superoxide dismutase
LPAPFILSPLPWNEDALEPIISARTMSFHYNKHHKGYVDTLNALVSGTEFAKMAIEEIVQATANYRDGKSRALGNTAGQVWNHDFYWRSLAPTATAPSGALASAIERDFGGVEPLIAALIEMGKTQFGSGWAWLVSEKGVLSVTQTSNAQSPMAQGINCLLTVDVWEHAYYLDYQNLRPNYLAGVLGKLTNWDFAAANLAKEARPIRSAVE